MSADKYPPISPGTPVRTTQEDPNSAASWTEEGKKRRKWGVDGKVITHHDSHGLCYDVRHSDGSQGCYDPTELQVLQ